jgi:hypothetical protein
MKYKIFFQFKEGASTPFIKNVSSEDVSKLYEILSKYGVHVFNTEQK